MKAAKKDLIRQKKKRLNEIKQNIKILIRRHRDIQKELEELQR